MWVITNLSQCYDWQPLPPDVKPTPNDLAARLIKPSSAGGYIMRVPKAGDTYNTAMIPEEQLISKIIHEKTEIGRAHRIFSRKEALAHYISENILPHEAHHSWIKSFEVHDGEGPNEPMLRAMLAPHFAAKSRAGEPNIDPADLEAHVKAYMEPADVGDLLVHLCKHFRVPAPVKAVV